jgi:hypothetical protein
VSEQAQPQNPLEEHLMQQIKQFMFIYKARIRLFENLKKASVDQLVMSIPDFNHDIYGIEDLRLLWKDIRYESTPHANSGTNV